MHQTLQLSGQTLQLLPERALFWQEKQVLVVADVHIGKAGHFRKHGIPVPDLVHDKNLQRLDKLIEAWQPKTLMFLGDLYHSSPNKETIDFDKWSHKYADLNIILTLGNHDTDRTIFEHRNMHVKCELYAKPFIFRHIPEFETESNQVIEICGHIHPSLRVPVKARQNVRLPAFILLNNTLIIPAFGEFTGSHNMKGLKNARQFVIVEDTVIEF